MNVACVLELQADRRNAQRPDWYQPDQSPFQMPIVE